MAKIQYNDKVNIISQPVPEVNKVTAANLNEIKTSVNINVDNIALNATDLSLKADIGGNSSEIFKVSNGLSSNDAVNKEQLESLDTTLQNNIDLKADIASIVNNVTAGGSSVPLSAEQGKVLKAEITALAGSLIPQGNWDASTNTPDISGTTQTGYYWFVSVEGATDIGGITDWKVSDWVVKTADGFAKIDNTDKVLSVAGKIGDVVLAISDITSLQTSLNLKANKASPSFTGDATFGGSVGIGTGSSDIKSILNISQAEHNTPTVLTIENKNANILTDQDIGRLDFYTNDVSGFGTAVQGRISNYADNPGNQAGLKFYIYKTELIEALRIDKDQKVKAFADFEAVGDATFGGSVQADSYKSSDGTVGISETVNTQDGEMIFKDGLLIQVFRA